MVAFWALLTQKKVDYDKAIDIQSANSWQSMKEMMAVNIALSNTSFQSLESAATQPESEVPSGKSFLNYTSSGENTPVKAFNLLKLAEEGAAKTASAEGAVWVQKTFSAGGNFAGQTVEGVAGMLRSGTLSAADVPINVVVRNGQTFILNTRSSAALMQAGIPRSAWNVVNQTGVSSFESMLTGQLGRNGLINGTNTIRQSGTQLILSH